MHEISRLSSIVQNASEFEKHFFLILDEMSIEKNISYSRQLKQVFGFATLSPRKQLSNENKPLEKASNLLVVLARGLTTRFKIIVGWHLTGASTERTAVKSFIMTCISELTKIGCTILNIARDMGIMNQGLFSDCGMKCKRQYIYRTENNTLFRQCNFSFCISMPNPITHEPIYFTHDPMHLCKTFGIIFYDMIFIF